MKTNGNAQNAVIFKKQRRRLIYGNFLLSSLFISKDLNIALREWEK
jgi:hypothetical protein